MTPGDDELERVLKSAQDLLGPELNGNVPRPLYDFLRRYGPMACADVVLVPECQTPSVLLARRGTNAVAPCSYYVIGGRIDKHIDLPGTINAKVRSEVGLELSVSWNDLIGLSLQSWPPNSEEAPPRDYSASVIAPCFAARITPEQVKKAIAGDGHTEVRVFPSIDPEWHAHVRHATACAWDRFYGRRWRENASAEVKAALADRSEFISLRYAAD